MSFSTSIDSFFIIIVDFLQKKHKIYWTEKDIKFTGKPFMILATKILDCHHGNDRCVKKKEIAKENSKSRWVIVCLSSLCILKDSANDIFYVTLKQRKVHFDVVNIIESLAAIKFVIYELKCDI